MAMAMENYKHEVCSSPLQTLSISLGEETTLPPPQGFSHIRIVNYTWSNHSHHHITRSLLFAAPPIIDLPLKLDSSGQLFLSLDMIKSPLLLS